MNAVIRPDYDQDELRRFEAATGSPVDFTLTLAWARAAEASGYGEGVRAMVTLDGDPVALAQGILRRRYGITKLASGSNGGVGLAWRTGHDDAGLACLDHLLRRTRPSGFQIFSAVVVPLPRLKWEPAFTFEINLEPPLGTIIDRMSKEARYAARRAEKLGVSVRVADTRADLNRAYDLIERTSEARHFALPPRNYSLALHREFGKEGHQTCVVATLAGTPVSAAALLGSGRKVSWWKGGSTEEGYRASAGNPVQLAAIRWAKDSGFRTYDLGGTDPHRETYAGIHRFKASLGGNLVERTLGNRTTRMFRLASRLLHVLR